MYASCTTTDFKAGFAFHFNDREAGGHLFFIASSTAEGEVVVFNLTTVRRWSDTTCIIEEGEHVWVKHKSCIAWDLAAIFPTSRIIEMINSGLITPREPLSVDLMMRVWEAAAKTKNLPIGCRAILRRQSAIP